VDQVEASVALESDGFGAVVVHQLRLFGPKDQLLGEWKVDEYDAIEGLGEGAIPDALGRAAGFAAQLFESERGPETRRAGPNVSRGALRDHSCACAGSAGRAEVCGSSLRSCIRRSPDGPAHSAWRRFLRLAP
jgi:hypothetical protein